MDDPTRRCENDTGNETRLQGLLFPSKSPNFFVMTKHALRHSSIVDTHMRTTGPAHAPAARRSF